MINLNTMLVDMQCNAENACLTNREVCEYTEKLMEGKVSFCRQKIDELFNQGWSIEDVFLHLFTPSLVKIGEKWEKNEISVADEHIASCLVETLLTSLYPKISEHKDPNSGLKAIVTCTEGEHHQIGAKMISYLLELWGVNVLYLGADLPLTDLMILARTEKPDFILFSITLYSNFPHFVENSGKLCDIAPDSKIIAGGQAFKYLEKNVVLPDNIEIFKEVSQLKNFIQNQL